MTSAILPRQIIPRLFRHTLGTNPNLFTSLYQQTKRGRGLHFVFADWGILRGNFEMSVHSSLRVFQAIIFHVCNDFESIHRDAASGYCCWFCTVTGMHEVLLVIAVDFGLDSLMEGSPIPSGSMGLAYLPTWMVDFYGKCREIYHTWILWEI